MKCLQCQHENVSDAKFCNQCGTPLMVPTSAPSSSPSLPKEAASESRFQALIRSVKGMLQRERRVTYRTLKHVFSLEDGLLEEVKEELFLIGEACDEHGKVLVWTGETQPVVPAAVKTLVQPQTAEASSSQSPAASTLSAPVTEADTRSNGPATSPEVFSTGARLDEPVATPEVARSVPEAERRQLTVMFCDLIGSTDLSGKLDPEDLREVVRAYQETAAGVIQRYEGHIAQYLGDGLLIYFGFPVAHEDDAPRAVYTGLGIPEALAALNARLEADYGVQLAVRIGIHTGPVVVGEMGGGGRHENLALGETPNIAARLEGLAQANTAVISPVTAQLVQRSFVLEELGPHELKGVADPMMLYAVVEPREVEPDDHEAMIAGGFDALVGRDEEIGLLVRRWEQTKEGRD
ncbi:MAG: zinc-ribbon domain-containing protein, partial [Candidatus Tectomicrobia bacterium]|nr:zinc-ribbon domain-containing protein [Candidatus Tectomicrobia bacterium]